MRARARRLSGHRAQPRAQADQRSRRRSRSAMTTAGPLRLIEPGKLDGVLGGHETLWAATTVAGQPGSGDAATDPAGTA
jgi:hypothetical protein